MVGWMRWGSLGRFTVTGDTCMIGGCPLYRVSLSEKGKLLPLRLKLANQLYLEKNIRSVIVPEGFLHWESFPQCRPFEPLETLQGLGGEYLLYRLAQWNLSASEAVVVLEGDRVTSSMERVAWILAPRVREVVLSVGKGGEQLQERLYQQFGMAPSSYRQRCTAQILFQKERGCSFSRLQRPPLLKILLDSLESDDFRGFGIKNIIFPEGVSTLPFLGLLLQTERFLKKDVIFS